MKSKKKLIYKLHQNFNQNPFKKIDEVSFRNAGTGSYDFNKLKSIRAISLKGLESDQIHTSKNSSDWRKKYDLTMNMVSIKEEIQQKAQQALICNKKKIVIDKSLINMQPKKLNVRNLLKQKHLQAKRQQTQNQGPINSTEPYQDNNEQDIYNKNLNTQIPNEQKIDFSELPSPRPRNQHGHSRNISLPVINNHKQQTLNSMTFVTPNKQLDLLVEEQRAKQQILKQIRFNAQEKINKQVLMSIKLKSIQNLERIARSQSQVIKIDKWKQKYGQLKNGDQTKHKDKYEYTNGFFPQIQSKNHKKDDLQNLKHKIKPSLRYMETNEDQVGQLQKSDIQLAKDLLNNVTAAENFYRQNETISCYNSTNLKRQFPSLELNSLENKMNDLERYENSQIMGKDQIDNTQFWYSQPLKITITQLKKQYNINKQNQNLSPFPKDNSKLSKLKGKSKKLQNKNTQSNSQTETKQNDFETDVGNNVIDKQQQKQQNYTSVPQKQFKTSSRLYMSLQKGQTKYDEQFLLGSPMALSSRRNGYHKCKINQQNNILDKIIEDGIPKEWQQKRYGDEELTDFDIFVQNEAKQVQET